MTRRISLARIDQQSIRGYFQTAELPEHHEREAANKPWRTFEVMNTTSGNNTYNWETLRSDASSGDSPCPTGYRIPNQRELALMHSRIGNDGNWTLNNHFRAPVSSSARTAPDSPSAKATVCCIC